MPPTEVGYPDNAEMFAEVYDELRRIARRCYGRNAADATLQPTALVNEAFTRIVRQRNLVPGNREQFLGVAAIIIRRKWIDYRRRRMALAAGGGAVHVELEEEHGVRIDPGVELTGLDEALERLRDLHARQAKVVDYRFFLGMKNQEVADALGISIATVKTDWKIAQAFLFNQLQPRPEER